MKKLEVATRFSIVTSISNSQDSCSDGRIEAVRL